LEVSNPTEAARCWIAEDYKKSIWEWAVQSRCIFILKAVKKRNFRRSFSGAAKMQICFFSGGDQSPLFTGLLFS